MELMQASARDSGIKKLYKYRVFDKGDSDYVKRIFTRKELYIPSPSQLNDPFECKPRFILGDLSSPSYQKKHEEFFLRLEQQKSHVNKADLLKHYRSISKKEHEERTRKKHYTYKKAYARNYRKKIEDF